MSILRQTMSSYDKFFFEERPTEGIAVFRILWTSIIFIYFLMDLANVQDFYSPHALISNHTVQEQFPFIHANLFNLFTPSYEFTYGLLIVYGLALLTSMAGFFTRTSLFVVLICMTSLHQRNIWLLSSSEVLMRTITLLLLCSPCGHSLSIDSLRGIRFPRSRLKKNWSVWALRLIQIQISVVYIWTVLQKLKGESWLDGSAVYYATRLDSMRNFSIPFILDSLPALKVLTWSTLLIEMALGTLVWSEKFRKPAIMIGLFFHLSILFVMGIWFEVYMMVLLINFYKPEEIKAFITRSINSVVMGIEESNIATAVKERMIRTLRGQA